MNLKTPKRQYSQLGFTIVELLVALTIASVLTTIALPTLKDSLRQNSLSRAASLVKGAFINARSNAIRSGRPYGLVIERQRPDIGSGAASSLNFTNANYATRMYYVQSPLEYRGDIQIASAYPFTSTERIPAGTGPSYVSPRFFVPQNSAGLLYAAAQNVNSPARRLVDRGTRFSIGELGYVFQVTGLSTANATAAGLPATLGVGTVVEFDFLNASPQHSFLAGRITLASNSGQFQFPGGFALGAPQDFKFRVNPVRAPLAPVTMIGRTVIDLSVSGPASDPIAFNAQEIVDEDPSSVIPNLAPDQQLNDIVIMFAPDGRLDGVFSDTRVVNGGVISGFGITRLDPSTTVSFNVGFLDGVLDNIDDGARFPETVSVGTNYQITTDDPPLATPGPPAALTPRIAPNFANTDCAWISIQPLSGAIRLDSVASQPGSARLVSYYGYQAAPNEPAARQVVRDRVSQSRRLNSGGSVK